jgi:hypothetical protein
MTISTETSCNKVYENTENNRIKNVIQLAYGTSVVLLRCPSPPEIIYGRAPEVFLTSKAGTSLYDLYCVGVT